MATSIKCPNCASELDVENMLSADAEEKLKRQYEQQLQQSLFPAGCGKEKTGAGTKAAGRTTPAAE